MRLARGAALGMICMLLCICVTAAPQCGMTGPESVRVGDQIAVTLSVSQGGCSQIQGLLDFNADQLLLMGYETSQGWSLNFLKNRFTLLADKDAAQVAQMTLLFRIKALPAGTQISVACRELTAQAQGREIPLGDCSWGITVSEPLSMDHSLTYLEVEGGVMTPEFHPEITSYRAAVPFDQQHLKINASGAYKTQVNVENPGFDKAGNACVTVTVTAESGSQRVYTIHVSRSMPMPTEDITKPWEETNPTPDQKENNKSTTHWWVIVAAVLAGAALGGAGAILLEDKIKKNR